MSTATQNDDHADADSSGPEGPAGRREWLGLAALVLPTLLVSMDLAVLILATPALHASLRPSGAQLLWITDIYGFLVAGSLITMGTLGDRIGRRRLLIIGAVVFAGSSLLAAFAPSAGILIVARAAQGVAGATLMPSTLALIRTMFAVPRQRTFAVAIWTTTFAAGTVLGPLMAGVLLSHFWWGSVFLPNVPVLLVLLVAAPLLLPESRNPKPGRFDLASATLSVAAVLLVIYGVKRLAEDGVSAPPVLAILGGLALAAVFVRRQRRLEHPLLDLALFRKAAFSTSVGVNLTVGVLMAGTFLLIAQYLQLGLGFSAFEAALWMLPQIGTIVVMAMVTGVVVRRVPAVRIVAAGLLVGVGGLLVYATVDASSDLVPLVLGSVLLGLGIAPASMLSTDLIVGTAPHERAGAASAISETAAELGNALGIAILGSIGIAAYRSTMAGAALPTDDPAAADAARSTLGGAVELARHLPGDGGAALLWQAHEAFTAGLRLSAGIGAAVAVALAVVTTLLVRRTKTEE